MHFSIPEGGGPVSRQEDDLDILLEILGLRPDQLDIKLSHTQSALDRLVMMEMLDFLSPDTTPSQLENALVTVRDVLHYGAVFAGRAGIDIWILAEKLTPFVTAFQHR
jgi:hypothetical protein